jgi:hypothetical protein
MKDFADMAVGELDEHVSRLKGDLEEVEEERMFVLSQTGLHVSAGAVKNYETEVSSLKARIEAAEQAVRAKRAE